MPAAKLCRSGILLVYYNRWQAMEPTSSSMPVLPSMAQLRSSNWSSTNSSRLYHLKKNDSRMNKEQDIVYIGTSNFRGSDKIFGIKNKDRFQHMYVIGQTGTGKTSLIRNLAIQDIEAGRGVAVVDP